ncbi:endolytic transglycosylase MltG, partial [Streptomyces sp. SPB074]|uniref:endolytic transglycosylase MltG n=1 Tax=Streptomyces sp. (strain SPB074) TaxID=465543 RepID=UPI0001D1DC17
AAAPPRGDWDPDPDEPEHPFFASDGDAGRSGGQRGRARDDDRDDLAGDEDDAEDGEGGARAGRRGGEKPKKRRGGCACLVVAVVLIGGGGGAAYYGYGLYQDRFGPPPDYAGEGSGTVVVEIPDGSTGIAMGNLLKDKGVVKSVEAFTAAQKANDKGTTLQSGFYTLHKGMSGESAVELMLDPKSRKTLIVPEGYRNGWVYAQIDGRLGLKKGTTADVAKSDWKKLGLPEWADDDKDIKDPLEGFLYPSSYSVSKGQKPADVLRRMVAQANKQYEKIDVVGQAEKLKLDSPLALVTVASMVNAEGKTHDDFRKMAEVIYNRLKPGNTETNGKIQFDSTYNYLTGRSEIKISTKEINSDPDPYNTYYHKGLPPGPIGNPGAEAFAAALNPTKDGWMYFVAVDGKEDTQFAKTLTEFKKLEAQFNASDAGR